MEHQRLWIGVVVAMAMIVLPFNCLATDYTVGDSAQWDLGVNYTTWASGKTFTVGDKLVFKYTVGAHDVLVLNKAAYDSCLKTNPLATHTTGNDTITLNATGAHYYICGIGTHCSLGMKLNITVAAASISKSNGTVQSPSPSPSPSSGTPTTPTVQSPSPSSPTVQSPSPSSPTVQSPSPSSATPSATPTSGSPSPPSTTIPSVPTPASSTNGANPPSGSGSNASAATPSYPMGGVLLLGGSLLLAMASL